MIKGLLSIVFSLTLMVSYAQFSITPTPLSVNVAANSGEFTLQLYIQNSRDTTYNVYWKVIKNPNTYPQGWVTFVCDFNFCYLPNVDSSSPGHPNVMRMGTHNWQFHFRPEGITGSSVVVLKLYEDAAMTKEIFSAPIQVTVGASSTRDLSTTNIQAFPNPMVDYFQIANGTNVKKVVLYNVLGREVKSFFHYNNAQHEVSDLRAGMYVVRLLDDKSRVIKTLKLNKLNGGA